MARQILTVQAAKGPYPGIVAAGDLDLVFTVADPANKEEFAALGRELLLAWNTDTLAHNIGITSANTRFKRTADIGPAYSVAAGVISHFYIGKLEGWRQTGGKVWLEADDATVKFAIVRFRD